MKFKKGMLFKDKNTGKLLQLKNKATGNKHWNCLSGKKSHKIHEGTLIKFYEKVLDN